jgi:hypothetical protein
MLGEPAEVFADLKTALASLLPEQPPVERRALMVFLAGKPGAGKSAAFDSLRDSLQVSTTVCVPLRLTLGSLRSLRSLLSRCAPEGLDEGDVSTAFLRLKKKMESSMLSAERAVWKAVDAAEKARKQQWERDEAERKERELNGFEVPDFEPYKPEAVTDQTVHVTFLVDSGMARAGLDLAAWDAAIATLRFAAPPLFTPSTPTAERRRATQTSCA